MKNIETLKKKYTKYFSQKYYNKTLHSLTEQEFNRCSLISEFWSYIYLTIPEGYAQYNIFDFHGNIQRTDSSFMKTIPSHIVSDAREKICDYCWGMKWSDILEKIEGLSGEESIIILSRLSRMMERLKEGNSVVVFGNSSIPIGRTLVASIIMKEAIRLRILKNARGQTYDWVDFSVLSNILTSEEQSESVDYRTCDWLVVDNIINKTRTSTHVSFYTDKLDPFFLGRFRDRLPTILVFKFDVRDQHLMMEKNFGTGICNLINAKKTFKIPLSEPIIQND